MTPHFELKDYQQRALDALRAYFLDAAATGDAAGAFFRRAGALYLTPPPIAHLPFVCLRVPTGGGKTLLSAHAVNIAAQTIQRTDRPVAIWFTPSTTIRDQTLKSLRDREHPNRRALAAEFGENIRIMDTEEALHARRPDFDGGAVVIVCTIQAFRTDNTEGRKVYEANGDLMDHFSGLPQETLGALEQGDDGQFLYSLANVLRLRRPLVIADEAHNMSTGLSFETLARLNPSAIVEFTATPTKHSEHDPAKGKFASNVLHHVTAAELKAADMIKMPVVLRGRPDPKETVADALRRLENLEALAKLEERATGEFVRPLMLLQAEPESKTATTIHAEALKTILIEDFRIPADQIAISTGKVDDLDKVDLFARDCPIRFIVTQQKLREGWDCSFAYVLCSVAPQKSERSVEQLLGRILRLPRAKRKTQEELNTAFAFATTTHFQEAAKLLADGLVANGFEKSEATTLVCAPQLYGLEEGGVAYEYAEAIPEALDPEPFKARIENATGGRVTLDLESRRLVTRGALSKSDRLHMTMVWPEAAPVIDALHAQSWRMWRAEPPGRERLSFTVPALCVRSDAQLALFGKEHFLDTPWPLETCDPSPVVDQFTEAPQAQGARIDVDPDGEVRWHLEEVAQAGLFGRGAEWSRAALIHWLDRRIGERRDITPVSSRLFIGAALDRLMAAKGLSMDELGRARFRLNAILANVISSHRRKRESEAWNAALFQQSGLDLVTESSAGFYFDSAAEHEYGYRTPYRGAAKLPKHVFSTIGDLDPSGEEYECAFYLAHHARVRAWVRNTVYSKGAFWLQTASDRFYPDFVAQLEDGRVLAVEYKGAHLATTDDSREKQLLGELWAEKSGGACAFAMVVDRDFTAIDRAMAARGQALVA